MPKTISEHCELVKLCYINLSGPVFFRYTVFLIVARSVREKMSTFTSFLFIMLDKTDRLGTRCGCRKQKIQSFNKRLQTFVTIGKNAFIKNFKKTFIKIYMFIKTDIKTSLKHLPFIVIKIIAYSITQFVFQDVPFLLKLELLH